MFKKKLLMILAIVVLISIPSQAGIFGGKGGGGSLNF